jgi:biotin transport system substrate-specific component
MPMADPARTRVLADTFWQAGGQQLLLKRLLLVGFGVAALAAAAKIQVSVWPSPVPITMGTFAVLTIGAAYGPRLGLATMLAYLGLGALGWNVFAGSSAEVSGLAYMAGSTGRYLVGYLLATVALGEAARRGWDRSVLGTGAAFLIGTTLIYIPGVLWLGVLYGFDQPLLAWGLYPFLIGDALKAGLAAILMPALWGLLGRART